jgi:hypothetical protein
LQCTVFLVKAYRAAATCVGVQNDGFKDGGTNGAAQMVPSTLQTIRAVAVVNTT